MAPATGRSKPYHHGSLRADVIAAAVAEVQAVGAAGVSMREIARRAGVSHAAPIHHFGDKTGLFTAIATEGFRLITEAIEPVAVGPFGFLDGGAAYVTFALAHPGHFEVMFRPALYRQDDPDLVRAKTAAVDVLESSGARTAADWGVDDAQGLVLAGWALVHGLATLLLTDNLDGRFPTDPAGIADHLARGLIALGYLTDQRARAERD